jgi:hypothetical protein
VVVEDEKLQRFYSELMKPDSVVVGWQKVDVSKFKCLTVHRLG